MRQRVDHVPDDERYDEGQQQRAADDQQPADQANEQNAQRDG
ncbi:hypothetical protein QW131_15910 [Roseibium salinum]|nr:hypothetical protein [Roseibium salinum]